MQSISAIVSTKYQVVIPKEIREALHLQPKDTILFQLDGDRVFLRPRPANFTQTLRGLHQDVWEDGASWLARERDWE
jgi:AbrB family looped-hinge helix DNA binding protein